MTASSRIVHRAAPAHLLRRLLDEPRLLEQVQTLPPPLLAKLIDRVGLEDAGEVVALATTEQLAHVFDEDLWKSETAGEDESFDAERFALWLGVMREAGDRAVATRLSELPEELVTYAFHRHVIVLGMDALANDLESGDDDADQVEKALADCLSEEMDEYLVISRLHNGWDDVIAALLALDELDHGLATRILERCCSMSAHAIDESGLYSVLSEAESLEADVAGDRQSRRAEEGHVAPSDAKAFLELARTGEAFGPGEHDAITRAYLREANVRHVAAAPPPGKASTLARWLADEAPRRRDAARALPARREDRREELLLLAAMRALEGADVPAFVARSTELAYLANLVLAGVSVEGRRLRPVEAVSLALATTSLGLEMVVDGRSTERAAVALGEHVADGLFRRGWHALEIELRQRALGLRTKDATLEALADRPPHWRTDQGPSFIGTRAELGRAKAMLDGVVAASRGAAPRKRTRR